MNNSAYDLSKAYETSLSREVVKKGGIFYTPPSIVSFMVSKCLALFETSVLPKIIDPSCGSGLFLLECFRQQCHRLGPGEKTTGAKFIFTQLIFGIDKEEEAVSLCKKLLCSTFKEWTGEDPSEEDLQSLHEHITCNDCLLSEIRYSNFDVVIGNPPYGLSRDGQLEEEEREALKAKFSETIEGKPNKYLLFIAQGYSMLSERGVLSFIVPNSWLGIRGGRKIRLMFLRDKSLQEIIRINGNVFGSPGVEPVIFTASKRCASEEIKVSELEMGSKAVQQLFTITATECLSSPDAIIPVQWNECAATFFQFLRGDTFCLNDSCSPFISMIALQAYREGGGSPKQTKATVSGHPFHSRIKTEESMLPYVEGKDVSRFALRWSANYLSFGPWLAEFPPIERFSGPRVLIREILGKGKKLLQCAYTEEVFLYNRSVLHILPKSSLNAEKNALALLAILNSSLASFVLRFKGRKTQRKLFPKIVNDDLKCFPLPARFSVYVDALSKVGTQCILNQSEENERALNKVVYAAYGLNSALIEIIDGDW